MESVENRLAREEIELAPFSRRFCAYAIDELIISVLFMVIYYEAFVGLGEDMVAMSELMVALGWQVVALKVIYQAFFVWYYGATPGKIACKIVVLDAFLLSKPGLMGALVRAAVRMVSEWAFWLGFLWALGNDAKQGWHDKIAKTVVCRAS